jgi:hypothetical protein
MKQAYKRPQPAIRREAKSFQKALEFEGKRVRSRLPSPNIARM